MFQNLYIILLPKFVYYPFAKICILSFFLQKKDNNQNKKDSHRNKNKN